LINISIIYNSIYYQKILYIQSRNFHNILLNIVLNLLLLLNLLISALIIWLYHLLLWHIIRLNHVHRLLLLFEIVILLILLIVHLRLLHLHHSLLLNWYNWLLLHSSLLYDYNWLRELHPGSFWIKSTGIANTEVEIPSLPGFNLPMNSLLSQLHIFSCQISLKLPSFVEYSKNE